ncbi:hypothetical protein N7501_008806 [Penicillium viridicatum]|nr:hypothetical protein N7501_008806 [Penicillium viridicatum]
MPPKILLIGASGYIGGSTLSSLLESHPSWDVTAIVRNEEQASAIHDAYPGIPLSTVIGTLDTPGVLISEAAKASITLQLANGDHNVGTDTLLSAIASSTTPESARYYIHLSGAATVLDLALAPGSPPSRSWDDTSDLSAILDLPATQIHAAMEQRIVSFGATHAQNGLRTAIISPPAVVGVGSGPIKKGAAYHINMMMQRKKAFVVGQGLNRFDMVHVKDVADAIVSLVEAANAELETRYAGNPSSSSNAHWNDKGYYFLTSDWVTPDKTTYVKTAQSLMRMRSIPLDDGVDHLTPDEATSLHPFGTIIFGGSLKIQGKRIRERLGWKASSIRWEDALEEEIENEVSRQERGEILGVGFGRE